MTEWLRWCIHYPGVGTRPALWGCSRCVYSVYNLPCDWSEPVRLLWASSWQREVNNARECFWLVLISLWHGWGVQLHLWLSACVSVCALKGKYLCYRHQSQYRYNLWQTLGNRWPWSQKVKVKLKVRIRDDQEWISIFPFPSIPTQAVPF